MEATETSIYLDWDFSAFDAFIDKLNVELSDIAGNAFGAAFLVAGESYMADIRARFGSLGDGGGTWPELSPGYAKQKISAVGFEHPILVRTGHLFLSLFPDQPDSFRMALPDGCVVGTTDAKAQYHQQGSAGGMLRTIGMKSGGLPQRTILVDPLDPDMGGKTIDKMSIDLETGFQNLINECLQSTGV